MDKVVTEFEPPGSVSLVRAGPARRTAPPAPQDLADRVLTYCLARLSDPGLSVESVARAHGVSSRYLHKILQPREITLWAWVRRRRLERIREDLLDPAFASRTVSAIAARWGIADPTHLSRALKSEFGRTAAEIRRQARE